MAALRRVFLSGLTDSGLRCTEYQAFMATSSSWLYRWFDEGYTQNVRLLYCKVFIVDTTTLMRSIEAKGVPSEQVKAIISALRKMAGSADMEPSTDHRQLYCELDEIREEAEEGIAAVSPAMAEERDKARIKSYAATIAAHVILVVTIFIISKKDGSAEISA